ncbi:MULTISPECIES: phosphoglycerate kinase [Halomicrobium]|uniref:Phosphoglycerate kinase n=2 Tax=Halomicrobium mukohataei TaxID=57705 RepID=C7NYK7_HALMD|nr:MULTISPECIES: phosphoglycerate kinase [Halomicrobium]ACV46668.1 Phosphoglycerate kinase [Halomicrobium mukohataei DSM 12286]QCD65177.1 phosphoglycerate kinase [Halomicrobium mukohataei]QFR19983.1 phosphoglycerate kinase [Halomicrobium sp. ZPS1]
MAAFQTLDDLADGQRVLVRLDLNSPVEDGAVQDNRRFERHAKTVRELADRGFETVLMAHQGRPGRDTFVSLEQHADILSGHIGTDVDFVADTFGEDALAAIDDLGGGDVLLLENTRMCDEELPEEDPEVKAETEFVRTLAPEFDAYVNDAYSAAHRSHASLVGFPLVLPAYAGRVMETEYEANTAIAQKEFDGQVTMAVGGTKATDVIDVMDHLGDTVDDFLLGGIAGELFLRADGAPVGFDLDPDLDLYDSQWADNHELIERILEENREKITLATDMAYADEDGDRAETNVADIDEKTVSFMDVGSDTAEGYADVIRDSEAVFVKGALGVFEEERFSVGTVSVLEAIAETDCFSVVGGGDTSRAIEMYGMSEDDFGHVSIAGGAYIRALTGASLIGVEVLQRED